jgi:hypothetical protein
VRACRREPHNCAAIRIALECLLSCHTRSAIRARYAPSLRDQGSAVHAGECS